MPYPSSAAIRTAFTAYASKTGKRISKIALYSSMTESSYATTFNASLTASNWDTPLDASQFGYRVSSPIYNRHADSISLAGSSLYEHDGHSTTMMQVARRPVEINRNTTYPEHSNAMSVSNVNNNNNEPCLNAAMADSYLICDIKAAQAEWDKMLEEEYTTRPHFEMLKEDPYVEEIERSDQNLKELHDHDIVANFKY